MSFDIWCNVFLCKSFIKSTDITSELEIRVNICGPNVLLHYRIWAFGNINILIEIPVEKYNTVIVFNFFGTILGQRGGALAVLANKEDS